MPLFLFLLFLRTVLTLAFRRAEVRVCMISDEYLAAVFADVQRIILIGEHEAEYQRDRQHQGMKVPYQGWGIVKQRNAVRRSIAAILYALFRFRYSTLRWQSAPAPYGGMCCPLEQANPWGCPLQQSFHRTAQQSCLRH